MTIMIIKYVFYSVYQTSDGTLLELTDNVSGIETKMPKIKMSQFLPSRNSCI